jgi:hypothetical protein
MATVRAFQVAFGLHALYPIKLTISEIFQTLLVTPASICWISFFLKLKLHHYPTMD